MEEDRSESRAPKLTHPTRREFLRVAGGVTASVTGAHMRSVQGAARLPAVSFGPSSVTRLIAGSNPLFGGSHFNPILSACMAEYFTEERVVQFLLHCEKAGIDTWQSSFGERTQRLLRRARAAGSQLNWICLAGSWEWDPSNRSPNSILAAMMESASTAAKEKPLGMAFYGEVTDRLWRAGKMDPIHDFIDGVHDLGFPAGVSTHNPAAIEAIEEKGWATDFYMACFYRTSRTLEELAQEIGVESVGETYLSTDPPRMCKVIRQVNKTCFGFKILAAGRRCDSPEQVRQAFGFAFNNIKPTDAVIVGMFPKFSDHVSENARLTRGFAT